MKHIFLALMVLFYSDLASGEVYKWMDETGSVHYTDDFSKIPERYRSSITKRPAVQESTDPIGGETEDLPKAKGADSKDLLGRGEGYWKGRVKELKDKIRTLEERSESLRLSYNELTVKYNDSKNAVERAGLRADRDQIKSQLDQARNEIEETRIILEKKLPEEAESYKANRDWIK